MLGYDTLVKIMIGRADICPVQVSVHLQCELVWVILAGRVMRVLGSGKASVG